MKYEIRSIGLWSFVKISFFLNLALGFLFGILYALLLSFFVAISSRLPILDQSQTQLDDVSPAVFIVIVPIMMAFFMAVFNTIVGAIGILLYNLAAKLIGGLEMALEPVEVIPATPSSYPYSYPSTQGAPPPPPIFGNPPSTSTPPATPKPEPPASQFE